MERFNSLVTDLQRKHRELTDLMRSFENALAQTDRKEAKRILNRIDDVANSHFKFEKSYLYPRMRRLVFETMEQLSNGQDAIKELIKESRRILDRQRANKNRLSSISAMLPILSKHLEDCNDVVVIAHKFGREEKDELAQKFRAYCKTN